jgi:hypothetical protein
VIKTEKYCRIPADTQRTDIAEPEKSRIQMFLNGTVNVKKSSARIVVSVKATETVCDETAKYCRIAADTGTQNTDIAEPSIFIKKKAGYKRFLTVLLPF